VKLGKTSYGVVQENLVRCTICSSVTTLCRVQYGVQHALEYRLIFRPYHPHTVGRCGLLLEMSRVGAVCVPLPVHVLGTRLGREITWLNRWICRSGAHSCGPVAKGTIILDRGQDLPQKGGTFEGGTKLGSPCTMDSSCSFGTRRRLQH